MVELIDIDLLKSKLESMYGENLSPFSCPYCFTLVSRDNTYNHIQYHVTQAKVNNAIFEKLNRVTAQVYK